MQFIGSFSTFNPLNGYFSSPYSESFKSKVKITKLDSNKIHFPLILDWMAGRAQEIIKERKLEELENALNTINYLFYLVEEENMPSMSSNNPIEVIARSISSHLPIELFTPARILNSQVQVFSIEDNELFKNGRWEEYFAILALAALGDIHRFSQHDKELTIATVGLAAEAMEALTFAESPELIAPAMDPGLRKQSIRNSQNAIEGYTEVNIWKERFWDWLEDIYLPTLGGESIVKRKAARAFVAEHKMEIERAPELSEIDNLVRVLADSLSRNPRFPNL